MSPTEPSIMEAIEMGECSDTFHHTTGMGFCSHCGKAWKWRHRNLEAEAKARTECRAPMGRKPWYLNEDQWDADRCLCRRPQGHDGTHDCGVPDHMKAGADHDV